MHRMVSSSFPFTIGLTPLSGLYAATPSQYSLTAACAARTCRRPVYPERTFMFDAPVPRNIIAQVTQACRRCVVGCG